MKNKLIKKIMEIVASFFKSIAFSTSASACTCSFYQPNEPKCLRDE